jgi:prepilin-type N-terminal cleavage/methylation domain-containing protein
MKRSRHATRRGFTLIELSVALFMGLMTGSMVLAMFNQQLAFLKIYQTQSFLTEEAPMISMHVGRLVGKADRFRLHDSVGDALTGANPRLTSSPVVVLNFRQPDGTMRATLLAFEDRGTGPALYYYVVPTNGMLGAPQWAVSNKPAKVEFIMDQGVLRMILSGPAGEQITYSGTMQQ